MLTRASQLEGYSEAENGGVHGVLLETVAEQGQSASLLKEDHLTVLSAPGEALLNQAFSLPPFWHGLLPLPVSGHCHSPA